LVDIRPEELCDTLRPRSGTHDLEAHDPISDSQLALELSEPLSGDLELNDRVVPLGLMVDLVRQFALAPVVHLLDVAALIGNQLSEAINAVVDGLLVEAAVCKRQQFIGSHEPSHGRRWLSLSGARCCT